LVRLVLKESRVLTVCPVRLARRVLPGPRVLSVPRVTRASPANRVVLPVRPVLRVTPGPLVLLARTARRALLVPRERPDPLVPVSRLAAP
jgi:hypothetical protein